MTLMNYCVFVARAREHVCRTRRETENYAEKLRHAWRRSA